MDIKDNIYVVYGADFESEFGHKYFKSKKQAEDYKALKEKTKEFDFESYFIEPITIEDDSTDYSKIKLFSTISFSFDNYDSEGSSLEEDIDERKMKYYIDNTDNEMRKENYFNIVVGDYDKPNISINYELPIKSEDEIESLLLKIKKVNKLVLEKASKLCIIELQKDKISDIENNFIVCNTLEKECKNEIEVIFNG